MSTNILAPPASTPGTEVDSDSSACCREGKEQASLPWKQFIRWTAFPPPLHWSQKSAFACMIHGKAVGLLIRLPRALEALVQTETKVEGREAWGPSPTFEKGSEYVEASEYLDCLWKKKSILFPFFFFPSDLICWLLFPLLSGPDANTRIGCTEMNARKLLFIMAIGLQSVAEDVRPCSFIIGIIQAGEKEIEVTTVFSNCIFPKTSSAHFCDEMGAHTLVESDACSPLSLNLILKQKIKNPLFSYCWNRRKTLYFIKLLAGRERDKHNRLHHFVLCNSLSIIWISKKSTHTKNVRTICNHQHFL